MTTTTTERAEFITDAMLKFLDSLREIGVINMFEAAQYVGDEFTLSKADARMVLTYWMRTFSERQSEASQ